MNTFPTHLVPSNQDNFKHYLLQHKLSSLRLKIFEHMLTSMTNGFNLQTYADNSSNINIVSEKIDHDLVEIICQELKELGWETTLVYGNTMLFIFPPGKQPKLIKHNYFD